MKSKWMGDKDAQAAKKIGSWWLFGVSSSALKLVMKVSGWNYNHRAFKYMANSFLDILVLFVFWKGSELEQRKFLSGQEGKFHNLSANHTVELKLCIT